MHARLVWHHHVQPVTLQQQLLPAVMYAGQRAKGALDAGGALRARVLAPSLQVVSWLVWALAWGLQEHVVLLGRTAALVGAGRHMAPLWGELLVRLVAGEGCRVGEVGGLAGACAGEVGI